MTDRKGHQRVGGGPVLTWAWATSYSLSEVADLLRVERKWLENALVGTIPLRPTRRGRERRFDPVEAATVAVYARLRETGLTKGLAAEIARELGHEAANPRRRRLVWWDEDGSVTISVDAAPIRRLFDFATREPTEAERAAYREKFDAVVDDDTLARWRRREEAHYAASTPAAESR